MYLNHEDTFKILLYVQDPVIFKGVESFKTTTMINETYMTPITLTTACQTHIIIFKCTRIAYTLQIPIIHTRSSNIF